MITFFVPGIPVQQGSKRHVGNGRMIEASPNLKPWRLAVTYAAREARGRMPYPYFLPIDVTLRFWFPRPKSHYGTGKNAGVLKSSAPVWKSSAPDIDKLTRAMLDGMTDAGVWKDDAQVVSLIVLKRYANTDKTGVAVIAQEIA